MMTARIAGFLALGLCLSATTTLAVSTETENKKHAENKTEPVAEVGGKTLTMADLQEKEGGKLLQAEYQFYLQQQRAVEDLINDQLLSDEAKKKNMSQEQLLATEIYKGVKDPTEDQLEVYYEGMDSKEPYEAVREEVLQHIRELRRTKARAAYIDKLRTDAKINVILMPPVAKVEILKAYSNGSKNAPVVMIEFADYECPYCQKVNPQIQKLKKDYGDQLTIVYKDFPLPMHHGSQKAAEAARCAGEQGKFWEYHDVLYYSHQVEVSALKEHARVLKLDGDRFDNCLDSGMETAAVKKDLEEAKSLGLSGTPSFFVNNHFFSGVIDYTALKNMVDQQLAQQAKPHSKAEEGKQVGHAKAAEPVTTVATTK
jgi:protein-disulfide isomerase